MMVTPEQVRDLWRSKNVPRGQHAGSLAKVACTHQTFSYNVNTHSQIFTWLKSTYLTIYGDRVETERCQEPFRGAWRADSFASLLASLVRDPCPASLPTKVSCNLLTSSID